MIQTQALQGSFGSAYKRYEKNEPFVGVPVLSEHLTAWKNERVYAHLILWSSENVDTLSYEVSPISSSTDTIAAENAQLFFAGNVLADRYARCCGAYLQPRMDDFVEIADALSKSPVTRLTPGDPLKLWIHIDVPEDIHPGIYSGNIKVRQGNVVQLTFTLHIEVLDKSLPDVAEWTYHLDLWQYPFQRLYFYNKFHPDEEIEVWSEAHFRMLEPLYRPLAEAGQKVITGYITSGINKQPSMVKWILETDGTWTYDFTHLDAWIDMLTRMGISKQINCFSIIGDAESLPYYDRGSSSYKELDMPMFSEVYYQRWNDFLTVFKNHLKERNLFDKAVIYLDEVSFDTLSKIITLVHGSDPGWKIGLAYFHELSQDDSNALYDTSGLLGYFFNIGREEKVSTFYTSCAQTIPNTYVTSQNALAESAWMAWHAANQNLDGYLRWAYDLWTLDDPRDCRDSFNTSGDNMFVYRSTDDIDAEIRISYRLEMLRKGIQDFEKIHILKKELQLSEDPFDKEALDLLNGHIAQFHENSATGATSLVREGAKLLNAIVSGSLPTRDSDIKPDDLYGIPVAPSNKFYFLRKASAFSCVRGLNYVNDVMPADGYVHSESDALIVEKGVSFLLDIENSALSGRARTAVWIDWNRNHSFEDEGKLVALLGNPDSRDNPLRYRIPVTVPRDASAGKTRMRIQLRDSREDIPQSCVTGQLTGTTDLDIIINEPSGVCCPPVLISPYDREVLTDTTANFRWNANNHDVSGWKLKISNADSGNLLPVYYENSFDGSITSAFIPDLPKNGENLSVVLFWQTDGQWFSEATMIRAMDMYPTAMGISGREYFIYSIVSKNAAGNISFHSGDSPENGYLRIKNPPLIVLPGSIFILDIEESFASRCAVMKIWVDWKGNGSFTDPGDEVYADGVAESCANSTRHRIRIPVPGDVSPGVKRLRIRLCNSWLLPLQPCGMNNEATTYDIDIEVRSVP